MNLEHFIKSEDPKYSKNLRAWLKKQKRKWGSLFEVRVKLAIFENADGWKFIGYRYEGDVIGSRLNSVLCNGAREQTGSWCGSIKWKEVVGFWEAYARIGVCAIDVKHSHYRERWSNEHPCVRVCKYCGLTQNLIERKKVETVAVWEVAA